MELILRGFQWHNVVIYLDDIIIFSVDDPVENCCRVDTVQGKLIQAGLKLKPSKCTFEQTDVLFLGYI